jgi:hypothetical protein
MRLYYVPQGKGVLIPSKKGFMRPSGGAILNGRNIYEKQPIDREPPPAVGITGGSINSIKLSGGQMPAFDMTNLRKALIDTKQKKKIRL